MSRRLRYASDHSRESSSRGDHSTFPITEPPFQDFQRTKTTTTTSYQHLTVPSSFQPSGSRQRHASYTPPDLTTQYLQAGYDPSGYSRSPSSEPLVHPRSTSAVSPFGTADSDPSASDFSIDPSSLGFNVHQNISDPILVTRADMR